MKKWKFSLSAADEAPATAPILLQGSIQENLKKAATLGYDAIEVHTRENANLDYDAIWDAMNSYNVRISAVVTGRLNTEGLCSLIADEPYIAKATMEGMYSYIDMAQRLDTDIVIGWVKGNVPNGRNRAKYMSRLAEKLRVLASYGEERGVKLNLEVINRYEANIFNTADEVMFFLDEYQLENCYAHLDTFHMGIEERDYMQAIDCCKGKLGYFHLADNTRRYPGTGQFDFQKIFQKLDEIGYEGFLSVECLPYPDGDTAARDAIKYLKSLI